MRIKLLPKEERPRERLANQGEEALSNTELLAVLLGSGMKGKSVLHLAQELLSHFGSLRALAEASLTDLTEIKGLGQAKGIQLKAALSLSLRLAREVATPQEPIITANQAFQWVRTFIAHRKKEVFGVILQDVRGKPLRWEEVSVGTLTQTLVHPREVFSPAIEYKAASLILAHNHPSGDPSPSPEDIRLTRILVQASHSLGIPVNDHIVVTASNYSSLKELGVIKTSY